MSPSADPSRYQSRKFRIAAAVLAVAALGYAWGSALCDTAQDYAITTTAFGVLASAVLKLYNDANLKDKGE